MEKIYMNNKLISSAIALTLGSTVSFNACAALASNALLNFAHGTCGGVACTYDANNSPTNGPVTGGSYYAMDIAGNGTLSPYERYSITANEGVLINTTQLAYGSHTGVPNGTESPSIDMPFYYYQSTGMHLTTSPVTILSDDGAGQVTLDFSGWSIIWFDDTTVMDLGGHNSISPGTGIATLLCGTDCSLGDTFTLDYQTRIASTPFNGILYGVHLEGVIGIVPIPAAAWLFVSGLIGLAGVARRRKII